MAAYNNLLTTVTPARFKVGQMIGATGLLLGIALAMYRRVDADKRAKYKSMFISTVLAVFLTGVTEPLEFMFMFCAMPLYVVYAILQGCPMQHPENRWHFCWVISTVKQRFGEKVMI